MRKQDIKSMADKRKRFTVMISSWLILLIFLFILGRFFYLQIIMGDELQEEAVNQRMQKIEQFPIRGKIYDANNQILSMSLMTFDINVYPNLIKTEKEQRRVSEALSKHLGIEEEVIFDLVKTDSYWEPVKKKVEPDVVEKIKKENLKGIEYQQSPKRIYPKNKLGASVLGFVNDNHEPAAGVEASLNRYLSGVSGLTISEFSSTGEEIPIGHNQSILSYNGFDVYLTLDSNIQDILEQSLEKQFKETKAESAHAVIMNPKNGKILAMANFPSIDPNSYKDFDEEIWNNNPSRFNYEPGSIFKPLYMAIAFEEGVLREDEKLPSGRTHVHGVSISDWNGVGFGDITPKQTIQHSSNVAMVEIARRLKEETVVDYFKKLHLDKPTGVELLGEEKGANFPSPEDLKKDPVRHANVSFGQGISVTPLQMARAFSVFANGGYIVNPTLVEKIVDEHGNIVKEFNENEIDKSQRPFSKKTIEIMKDYLHYNMNEGSGASIKVKDVKIGGKTGTAWYVENGRYKKGSIIGSFIGFLPIEDPEYLMIIAVKDPNVSYGNQAAGPVFSEVMENILEFKTDRFKSVGKEEITLPDVSYTFVDEAEETLLKAVGENEILSSFKTSFEREGEGDVVVDIKYYIKNNKLKITFVTKPLKDDKYIYVPDFTGHSLEKISNMLTKNKIKHRIHGDYIVEEQSLSPGRYMKNNEIQLWGK